MNHSKLLVLILDKYQGQSHKLYREKYQYRKFL